MKKVEHINLGHSRAEYMFSEEETWQTGNKELLIYIASSKGISKEVNVNGPLSSNPITILLACCLISGGPKPVDPQESIVIWGSDVVGFGTLDPLHMRISNFVSTWTSLA